MKSIVIIEDSFKSFKIIRNHLNSHYNIFPKISSSDEFDIYGSLIKSSLDPSSDQEEARLRLKNQFKEISNLELFIIDLQLRDETSRKSSKPHKLSHINGMKFYDFFIKGEDSIGFHPALFLTGTTSLQALNILQKYTEDINESALNSVQYLLKQEDWKEEDFGISLREKLCSLIEANENGARV